MILAACILSRKHNVVSAAQSKGTIKIRLDLWEAGRFDALVAEVTTHAKVGVARLKPDEWGLDSVSESVAKKFNSMVLDGKLHGAVRFATGRGQGGPLRPDDACTKTG